MPLRLARVAAGVVLVGAVVTAALTGTYSAPQPQLAQFSHHQLADCKRASNVYVVAAQKPTTADPNRWEDLGAKLERFDAKGVGTAIPTDALAVTIVGQRVKWSVKPGVIMCDVSINYAVRERPWLPLAPRLDEHDVTTASDSLPLPLTAYQVFAYGYVPTEAAGGGFARYYTPDELRRCDQQGNVVVYRGRVASDPSHPWLAPHAYTRTEKPRPIAMPNDDLELVDSVYGPRYHAVGPGVIICQARMKLTQNWSAWLYADTLYPGHSLGYVYPPLDWEVAALELLVYVPTRPAGLGRLPNFSPQPDRLGW
jgi:hypothetical protein